MVQGDVKRVLELSAEQRRRLAARVRDARAGAVDATIPKRADTGPCALSFGQQRLWFLEQLSPGTATYNVPNAVRIKGPLNAEALSRALDDIVDRHEVLRTIFAISNGAPVQLVRPRQASVLRRVDAAESGDLDPHALLAREASRSFDLSRDLMLRALLVRRSPAEHLLLAVSHHIAWDPGSRAVFHEELRRLYAHYAAGASDRPAELPIQYADFAVWQRESLQGAALDRLTGYWMRQMAGVAPHVEIPADHPRPRVASFSGRKLLFAMPQELLGEASRVAARSKASLYIAMLSSFVAFLYASARQEDIVVGSPIGGRARPELAPLMGFFINTLAMRVRVEPALTFDHLLARVRETALNAYAHQDLPFEKLVEIVRPPRDRSRNPIFQINFRLGQSVPQPLALEGLDVEPLDIVDTGTSKFDLALDIAAAPGASSYFEYATDLFDESTMLRLRQQYEQLLRELLAAPHTPLGQLNAVAGIRQGSGVPPWRGRRQVVS